MGEHFTTNQAAAAAFGEAVFDQHSIGSTNITWAPDAGVGWVSGRGDPRRVYAHYSTRDDVWMVAAGLRFHFGAADAWFAPFFASVQPTLHTGHTPALSGCYEFTLTFGWQFQHWMIGVRHSSNANTHLPNLGESMLVAGITF
ncbi:MAG TPA: lipid A 3-O-deacylase [Dyella sp.]|uniref:lipid A 3-O-deacylase n=1 Tax=Dyella sp. TaxID=1869338 RepID=UPI002B7D04A3|nr:lipid A 3-O-deacylase [Dyella sp.]HTV86264.1 lipid A 3-O-deacylase [Dyella sp.]